MAQPNVAREPSMDEILASIRRIIENNDQPGFGDEPANDYGRAEDRDDLAFVDEETIVAEFHAEEERVSVHVEERAAVTAPPVSSAQPALSLADVAARVRAASERNANANAIVRDPEPAHPAHRPPEAARPDAMRPENPTVTARMAAGGSSVFASVGQQRPEGEALERLVDTAADASAGSVAPPADIADDAATMLEPVREIVAVSLMSEDVGAKVAQSFGALSQAVEAGPRRSFDEIAEEMLRPMLRDWLDDNLPTLVERLVREEIERVARGPRR